MRTYLLLLVFLVACLVPSVILISGYGRQAEATGNDSTARTSETATAAQPDVAVHENRQELPVASQPDDAAPDAQNPLIRGMRSMLKQTFNSSELDDERSQLDQSLLEADTLLSKAKKSNRDALRQANRQVRIRGPQSPNIVFILADKLDVIDLGCYGQSSSNTPNIDRLAASGVRFTNFSASSPQPAASRWSLMSGMHTGHAAQAGEESTALRNGDISLAELLWQGGYATGTIGLWGVPTVEKDSVPNDHGFDEWIGFRDENEVELYPRKVWSDRGQVKIVANADGKQGLSSGNLVTQEGLSFVERHHRERPFFLLLSYPSTVSRDDQQGYRTAVETLDVQVGRICDRLGKLGLSDNTIVMLTSATSASPNESDIRVPLIVSGPLPLQSGIVSDHAATMCDMYPTLAAMISFHHHPTWVEGRSFYSILTGAPQARR